MSQEAANRFFAYILSSMKDGQDCSQIVKNLEDKDASPEDAKSLEENVKTVYKAYYEQAQNEEFGPEAIPGVLLLAAITAFLGAAVWAGVAVFGKMEFGILAWGLGYVIGMAVLQGASCKKGVFLQLVAVIFSLLSIVGGKYMAFAYMAIGSVAKEHGAAAANTLSPLSFKVISAFVVSIPEMLSPYDGLWIFLAVASAWSILEPLGLDLNRLSVPSGADDTESGGTTAGANAPDSASLRAAFPGFRPTIREPKFSKGPLFNIGLFKPQAKCKETGAYVMTRYWAILGMPIWPLDAHVVFDTAEGDIKTLGTVPLDFSSRLGTWIAMAFALVVAFSITAVGVLLYMLSSSLEPNELLLEAQRLNKVGEFGKGAQSLAIAALTDEYSAEEATGELHSMVYKKLTGYPVSEAAGVLKAMFYLKQNLGEQEKYKKPLLEIGMDLVKSNKEKDPKGSLKLLKVLRQIQPEDKTLTDMREKLCKEALKSAPDDVFLLNSLGEVYLGQLESKKVIELLQPHVEKLGKGLGELTLGMAYAKEKQNDKAVPLLQHYVDGALPKHLKVRQRHGKYCLEPLKDQIRILNAGLADDFNYDALKDADPATQQNMLLSYARYKVMRSPDAHLAQIAYDEHSVALSGAILLATIRTNSAELLSGREKKKELSRADYLLSEIEPDLRGETSFKILRARVFHMLGRQKDAHAILEKMEKRQTKNFSNLTNLASLWLKFGKKKRAEALAREAHTLARTDEEKDIAAALRAETAFDIGEKIRWMSQCKKKEGLLSLKFELLQGHHALEKGEHEKARTIFKEVINRSAELTKEEKVLSGGFATAAFALYSLSGSLTDLEKALSMFEMHHEVNPRDKSLDSIEGNLFLLRAVNKIAGDEIDFKKLKAVAKLDCLYLLCNTENQRMDLISRLEKSSDYQKAVGLFKSALEREPANPDLYDNLLEVYSFTRDSKAIAELKKSLDEQTLNLESKIEDGKPELEEKRMKSVMEVRKKKAIEIKDLVETDELKPPTYCLAVSQIIGSCDCDTYLNSSSVADDNVQLATRAYERCGVSATEPLVLALLERAVYTINLSNPKLGDIVTKCHRMDIGLVLAMAIAKDERLRNAVRGNKDVKKAIDLLANMRQEFPWYVMAWEWGSHANN